MVYCGKPSTGCGRCRSRRIKCDQENPSCSQCTRAKISCPGYRDTLTLTFRDQSDEVIGKAQAQAQAQQLQLDTRKTTTPKNTSKRRGKQSPPLGKSLSCSETDLARGYMFSHYLSPGGQLSYMKELAGTYTHDLAVDVAITAVGLATLANVRMAPGLMLAARWEYTTALARMNSALRDGELSRRDDTLAAVVLLGMFEVTTCTDNSFFDRWMKHMDGAARLVEMRGPEQLKRPEGLSLFTQLRGQICIASIYREQYSLPIMANLTAEAKKHRKPEDRAYDDFGAVGVKLSELCAAIKSSTIIHPSDIIDSALGLDAELEASISTLPTSWNYRTVTIPQVNDGLSIAPATWGNTYHQYQSTSISSAWNNYRSARLIIHELIVDAIRDQEKQDELLHDFGFDIDPINNDTLLTQSQQIGRQMAEDIAASVPFHLGAAIETIHHDKSVKNTNMSTAGAVSAATGMAVVWPLLVSANSGFASQDMRRWITTVLERIGHSMGLDQALAMARLVREGMKSRAWLDNVECEVEVGLVDCIEDLL